MATDSQGRPLPKKKGGIYLGGTNKSQFDVCRFFFKENLTHGRILHMAGFKENTANSFRHIRIYDEQAYSNFCTLCRKAGTNATREINIIISDVVKKQKLPSQSAVILEDAS